MGALTSKKSVKGKGRSAVETPAIKEAEKHMTLEKFLEILRRDYGEGGHVYLDEKVHDVLAALNKIITTDPGIIPPKASEEFYFLFFYINAVEELNPKDPVYQMHVRSIGTTLGKDPKEVQAKIDQIAVLIDEEVAGPYRPPATAKKTGTLARVGRFSDNYYYIDGYYDDKNYEDDMDLFRFNDRAKSTGYDDADYYYNNGAQFGGYYGSNGRQPRYHRNRYGRRSLMDHMNDGKDIFGDSNEMGLDLALLVKMMVFIGFIALIMVFAVFYRHKIRKYKTNDKYQQIEAQIDDEREASKIITQFPI